MNVEACISENPIGELQLWNLAMWEQQVSGTKIIISLLISYIYLLNENNKENSEIKNRKILHIVS